MRELLRHRGPDRAEPVRRSARLPAEAASADPRRQQHVGDERQLGDDAAVRLDRLPRQQHVDRRFRSGDARLLADVRRPDDGGQVSAGSDPRLRQRGPDARRDRADSRSTGSRSAAMGRSRNSSGRIRSRSAPTSASRASTRCMPGNGAGSFDFDKDTTSSDGFTTGNDLKRQLVRVVPARVSRPG